MEERNNLYPIFLKVSQLNFLIVGGGNVGLEKLSFLLKSSPNAKVEVVAPVFLPELVTLAARHDIKLTKRKYESNDLENRHLIIACTDDLAVNKQVSEEAKAKNILVNVADTPELCDFYLGGVVTKGHVKIAISTNGKSPTTAKRIRQFLEEVIPEDINELVQNLNEFRKSIKGDFEQKVSIMNEMTKEFIEKIKK